MMDVTRKEFLKKAGAGILGMHAAMMNGKRLTGREDNRKRPNIVFIFADDLGWGDLGCYGHPSIKTPNIDRLAKEGILFTHFYVNSPVCSPSRTAIMTGQYPARHRIHDYLADPAKNKRRAIPNYLDPTPVMLTRLLQQNGYATGHFGKWHLGRGEGAPAPGEYGIDVHRTFSSNGPGFKREGVKDFRAKSTEFIIDETIEFIESNKERPFYVQAWLLDTHARLQPTEEQMKPYERFKGALKIYYAAATDVDKHMGRLMEKLRDFGLSDNTIVIFSSDNGPEDIVISNASEHGVGSPGPFRGRKRSLYEGGVREPFIVRWPEGTPAGRVDTTSVISGVDFIPTLCSLAGVELPGELEPDGEDMSAALRGTPTKRTKPLMWEWRFRIFGHVMNKSPILAMREGKWKLLMNPDRSRMELYDIIKDPMELNNLADKYPDTVEKMARQVLSWQAELPEGPVRPEAGKNDYPWPK